MALFWSVMGWQATQSGPAESTRELDGHQRTQGYMATEALGSSGELGAFSGQFLCLLWSRLDGGRLTCTSGLALWLLSLSPGGTSQPLPQPQKGETSDPEPFHDSGLPNVLPWTQRQVDGWLAKGELSRWTPGSLGNLMCVHTCDFVYV